MKYIKQFESNNFKLTIDNNYCWLIYGDVKGILKIYHKIEKPNKNKIKTGLEQSLKNDTAFFHIENSCLIPFISTNHFIL